MSIATSSNPAANAGWVGMPCAAALSIMRAVTAVSSQPSKEAAAFGSALAALHERAQQRVEHLTSPRADGAIVLPGRVLGDLQPGRVVLVCQRLHLHARLGEDLDGGFLRLALAGFQINLGSCRRL